MKQIEVHADIEARGRNGWFTLHEVSIFPADTALTGVHFYSKQHGENAPIILQGSKDAITKLFSNVYCALANTERFTDREVATILHGLRIIQAGGRIEGCAAGDCEHFNDCDELTNPEIDELCEALNFGDKVGA